MGKTLEDRVTEAMTMIGLGGGAWWSVELATDRCNKETKHKVRHLVLERLEEADEDAG